MSPAQHTVAHAVGGALVRCGVDTVVGVAGSGNFVVTNAMVAAGARYVAVGSSRRTRATVTSSPDGGGMGSSA